MEELYKNKKLIEKSNQDTSNFLFRMTQEIKKPVKDIISVSTQIQDYKDIEDIKKQVKHINNMGCELDYLINDALDVSSMTTKKLKIYDNRYNVLMLFKEIEYRFEQQISKNIKFNYSISNVLPTYLYGDSIKLKQAVNSILANALKHTVNGEIDLDISGEHEDQAGPDRPEPDYGEGHRYENHEAEDHQAQTQGLHRPGAHSLLPHTPQYWKPFSRGEPQYGQKPLDSPS